LAESEPPNRYLAALPRVQDVPDLDQGRAAPRGGEGDGRGVVRVELHGDVAPNSRAMAAKRPSAPCVACARPSASPIAAP
jgi:hypothetical protein